MLSLKSLDVLLAVGSLTMNSICIIVRFLLCGTMILCQSVKLVIDLTIGGEMLPHMIKSLFSTDNFLIAFNSQQRRWRLSQQLVGCYRLLSHDHNSKIPR